MEVVAVLTEHRAQILDEAAQALGRSHLRHYDAAGQQDQRVKLEHLFDVVVECLRKRQLGAILGYAERIASERFTSGYGIGEVQTTFNVLEESMWRALAAATPPQELAHALGLLTTVLGAGKDAFACAYVSMASEMHVPSLDLRAMFSGTVG